MLFKTKDNEAIRLYPRSQRYNIVWACKFLEPNDAIIYTNEHIKHHIIGTRLPAVRIKNILKEIENEGDEQLLLKLKQTMEQLLFCYKGTYI